MGTPVQPEKAEAELRRQAERQEAEDAEPVTVRRGLIRALLDVATGSLDFGSGFLVDEQVKALQEAAELIGVDPLLVTPHNFVCSYKGGHTWREVNWPQGVRWACAFCRHTSNAPVQPDDANFLVLEAE